MQDGTLDHICYCQQWHAAKWYCLYCLPPVTQVVEAAKTLEHPLLDRIRNIDIKIDPSWEEGYCTALPHSGSGSGYTLFRQQGMVQRR